MNLNIEHVLMFALVVCAFYYMRCNRVEGYLSDKYNCIRESGLRYGYGGAPGNALRKAIMII